MEEKYSEKTVCYDEFQYLECIKIRDLKRYDKLKIELPILELKISGEIRTHNELTNQK